MRILHFKRNYEVFLGYRIISFDPIQRILQGLKTSTVRSSRLEEGNYHCKQGGRLKDFIIYKDWYLDFKNVKILTIKSLSEREIQKDIGLKNEEFEELRAHLKDFGITVQLFFYCFLQGINKPVKISKKEELSFGEFELVKVET